MEEATTSDWTRRAFLKRAAAAAITGGVFGAARAKTAQGVAGVEKKPQPLSNDTAKLVPRTAFEGPRLEFDFPALQIGVAAYEEGPTGCTVFRFAHDPTSVIDVRGGYPGTIHGSWKTPPCRRARETSRFQR
jgi:hypothetical protein